MAATYWRGDDRTGSWWLKTYRPLTKELVRHSLETVEKARADLICRRVELEIELRRPWAMGIEVPPKLAAALGLQIPPACSAPEVVSAVFSPSLLKASSRRGKRTSGRGAPHPSHPPLPTQFSEDPELLP